MSRKPIPLITGEFYHVFNRGVDKRNIYEDKYDYIRFYQSLVFFNSSEANANFRLSKHRYTPANELVEVIAYSLLPNHYHLLLKQTSDGGISEFLKRVSVGYTGYFNEKYERSGVLFQGKFKRVHIENDEYFKYLFAYINENHYVHNLERGTDIYYSSSLHYQNKKLSKMISLEAGYSFKDAVGLARGIYQKRKTNNLKYLLE